MFQNGQLSMEQKIVIDRSTAFFIALTLIAGIGGGVFLGSLLFKKLS